MVVCCGVAGLEQYFCFPKADGKDKQVGFFSKLVDNELEGRFHVCYEGTVTVKEGFDLLGFCIEVMEVKKRPFYPICI